MKFVCSTHEFNSLLSKAQAIVPMKATIPIHGNVLIKAEGQTVTLFATDLIVSIIGTMEARVLEEGATTMPAKKLASLVREFSSPSLEFSVEEGKDIAQILSGSSRFVLHGMNVREFPPVPDTRDDLFFTVEQDKLKEALSKVQFAVSKEDTRYTLTGVCMKIADGTATFWGTDGKRLSRFLLPVGAPQGHAETYIIPAKAVDEIIKSLEGTGSSTLFMRSRRLAVKSEKLTLFSNLLEGEYPDIDRIIPEKSTLFLALHREELMSLLRQVSLFIVEPQRPVLFSFLKGELKLSAQASELGEGKVSMPVNYHGAPFEVAFNPSYIIDILRHSKQEVVTLALTDPFNPGIILDQETTPSSNKEVSPLFLFMPMRPREA